MTVAWSGMMTPRPALAVPASPSAEQEHAQKQIAAILAKLSKLASRELARPGSDPSDVKAKAMELAGDPERIFAFVRDEIRYEPYRGVLRGASGALLARAGNSFDKSLLLQAMLEANGAKCRLMRGELPADKAKALVDGFLKADALVGPLGEAAKSSEAGSLSPESTQFVQSLAAETGLDANALMQALNGEVARAGAVTAEAWATVDREAPLLLKRLETAGIKLGQPAEEVQKELEARATQHVWVEVLDPSDASKWIALDPSFPGSARGTAHATGQPLLLKPADEHMVTVKLIYKRTADNGQPEEKELINVPMRSRHAGFHFPQLVINPADELPPPSQMMAMKQDQLIKTLAGIKKFQPALRVGAESYSGQVFDLKGNLFSVSSDGRIAGASAVGTSTGGLFGGAALGAGGGSDSKDDDGPGKFLELSVTIDIAAPGAKPVSQKRVLLSASDVTGDHRRSPMLRWDMLVQPQPIGEQWVGNRSLRPMLALLSPMLPALATGNVAPKDVDSLAAARVEPHSGVLLLLALMRERAIARQLKGNPNLTMLWDAPLLAIAERSFCMNAKAGHACGNSQIDIVDNTLRFVARQPGGDAAGAGLRQGVFDTAAEALALRESLNTPGASDQTTVYSPIDDFTRARAAGDALAVFRTAPGAAPPAELALAESDRSWVAQHERPGQVIVAPSKPSAELPAPGWWSVDPASGCVIGRHAGGRGQAQSEYAVLTKMVAFAGCFTAAGLDIRKAKTGVKFITKMAGCMVAYVVGLVVTAPGGLLIWAVIAASLAILDKFLPD